jgi:hypothetical protein
LEGKAGDRVEPVFEESAPTEQERPAGRALPSAPPPVLQAPANEPVFYADAGDRADLQNIGEAIAPLAELCALREAQTPFLIGLVGPSGSGKSFALRRLTEAVESLAEAAEKTPATPFLSHVLVVRIDAAAIGDDPASALASAAFAALERGRDGVNYAALADEAAHAGIDPQRAALAAVERHDEIGKRLESERAARDEVEAKRARLSEALLYQTPGSRIDSFIRANRPTIDARLRRFDLAEGDAAANYRDLVRDLDTAGAASRATLAIRAFWGYRSQKRGLMLAVLAFVLAFCLDQVGGPSVVAAVRGFGSLFAPLADWLASHGDWLAKGADIMIAIGVLALLLTAWRAFGFSALLFRGLRLLNQDLRDRRREIDASAARLNQRVATLTAEADAAAQHAAAMAKRAGGAKPSARAPGPAFARGPEPAAAAARSFFVELGRLMSAPSMPAPQRLVFAFDNLDALASADALRLITAANTLFGPGCAGVVACDPAALASAAGGAEAARQRMEKVFQAVLDARTLGLGDSGRFAARLIGSNAVVNPLNQIDAAHSGLVEPLSQSEAALLTAIAPLAATSPRGVKRYLNAYRLARLSSASRPALALMLAVRHGAAPAIGAMRAALASDSADLPDPSGSSLLVEATQAARAANGGTITLSDARAAWETARRYALLD